MFLPGRTTSWRQRSLGFIPSSSPPLHFLVTMHHAHNRSIHGESSRRTSPRNTCLDPCPEVRAEYYTGLSRAKPYEFAGRGVIRSFSVRDPGSIKGSRFFHLQSVLDYLERAERMEANHAEVSKDADAPPTTPSRHHSKARPSFWPIP